MATEMQAERYHLDPDQLTRAGIVGLVGLFIMGIAFLIAGHEAMTTTRKWLAQQDRPLGETAKSALDQLHTAAMAAANAGSESIKGSGSA
jgi:hypothetical protein